MTEAVNEQEIAELFASGLRSIRDRQDAAPTTVPTDVGEFIDMIGVAAIARHQHNESLERSMRSKQAWARKRAALAAK